MVVTLTTTGVELDFELAVVVANKTEGQARATVLKVTQTELSHGFVASTGRRICVQIVERPSNSATAHTCHAKEVQRCKITEREAHSMVIEGSPVRAPVQHD